MRLTKEQIKQAEEQILKIDGDSRSVEEEVEFDEGTLIVYGYYSFDDNSTGSAPYEQNTSISFDVHEVKWFDKEGDEHAIENEQELIYQLEFEA